MAQATVQTYVRQQDKGQPAKRRWQNWEDQHGRWWGSETEIKTGDPCGTISPAPHPETGAIWDFPDERLRPAQKYLLPVRDQHGRPIAGRLKILYDEWMRDLAAAHAEWHRLLQTYAAARYGERAAEAVEKPTPELLTLVGEKPLAVEVVYAMKTGEPWSLGRPNTPEPAWVRSFLPPVVAVAASPEAVTVDPAFMELLKTAQPPKGAR